MGCAVPLVGACAVEPRPDGVGMGVAGVMVGAGALDRPDAAVMGFDPCLVRPVVLVVISYDLSDLAVG